MPRMALGTLVAFALLGGCYSWTLGASSDAGGDSPSGPMDGSVDSMVSAMDSRSPVDTATVTDTGTPPSMPDCATLQEQLDNDRVAAEECTTGCTSTVVDQCGCTVDVAQSSTVATGDYKSAIEAFTHSCTPSCGTCPEAGGPSFCLAGALPDGALTELCTQP
jgi:hypothetical protein